MKGNEAHGRTGRPPEETRGTLRTRRRSKALKQVVLPARDGRGIPETGCLCPKCTRHRREKHVYTPLRAVSGRSTAPAAFGGHTSESAGLRTLLGVNGDATDGGQMWGGALGLTGASGQGNRVPPRPSFGMDFLRYRTAFARQREKVEGSRMKRSIGHQCPGTRSLRGANRPSGRNTRRSSRSVTLVRKCKGRISARGFGLARSTGGFGCRQPRWFLRRRWFATLAAPREALRGRHRGKRPVTSVIGTRGQRVGGGRIG